MILANGGNSIIILEEENNNNFYYALILVLLTVVISFNFISDMITKFISEIDHFEGNLLAVLHSKLR